VNFKLQSSNFKVQEPSKIAPLE
jgi:hypothetical protein